MIKRGISFYYTKINGREKRKMSLFTKIRNVKTNVLNFLYTQSNITPREMETDRKRNGETKKISE